LKRIVVIQFVALLSLALAGTSIADTKKNKQGDAIKQFQQVLDELPRSNPKQGAGPTGVPSGTTSRGAAGRR
jgi:hypothetical protein